MITFWLLCGRSWPPSWPSWHGPGRSWAALGPLLAAFCAILAGPCPVPGPSRTASDGPPCRMSLTRPSKEPPDPFWDRPGALPRRSRTRFLIHFSYSERYLFQNVVFSRRPRVKPFFNMFTCFFRRVSAPTRHCVKRFYQYKLQADVQNPSTAAVWAKPTGIRRGRGRSSLPERRVGSRCTIFVARLHL